MFSVYLLRVNITIKMGEGGGGFTVLVSSQHGDKWMAKGQFLLQNDHFPRKDWGEFQFNTFLTEKSYHDCILSS